MLDEQSHRPNLMMKVCEVNTQADGTRFFEFQKQCYSLIDGAFVAPSFPDDLTLDGYCGQKGLTKEEAEQKMTIYGRQSHVQHYSTVLVLLVAAFLCSENEDDELLFGTLNQSMLNLHDFEGILSTCQSLLLGSCSRSTQWHHSLSSRCSA